jgi:DNA-binding Xre family transcriptional regulator
MLTSNVKRIMQEKKVTIRAMNEATGLSFETITRARKSQINLCRLNTLEIMASYLGCKVKDLFDED